MASDMTVGDNPRNLCSSGNIYLLEMHIEQNMANFKKKISNELNFDLSEASVWVLSQKKLSNFGTLQELCQSYVGTVQIQFSIVFNEDTDEHKIDILDVLKPPKDSTSNSSERHNSTASLDPQINNKANKLLKTSKWIESQDFKKIMKKYNIPKKPALWSPDQVEKWLSWVKAEFKLRNVNPRNLKISGRTLVSMEGADYQQLVPDDPGNIFCMHFELLRKTELVATLHCSDIGGNDSSSKAKECVTLPLLDCLEGNNAHGKGGIITSLTNSNTLLVLSPQTPRSEVSSDAVPPFPDAAHTSHTEVSLQPPPSTQQPIQLWQFLLKLLTDPNSTDIISWDGQNGEFKFHQPDLVAKMWGEQKGKSNMNYEKLSRSLRVIHKRGICSVVMKEVVSRALVIRMGWTCDGPSAWLVSVRAPRGGVARRQGGGHSFTENKEAGKG